MIGPPASLARAPGTSSLKARSASGGRLAVTAAPAARLRKKFRRVVGIGTSLLDCRLLLIAEKGVEGQSSVEVMDSRRAELRLIVCLLQTFYFNFVHLKHGLADAR